jgi:hypothetical protein
MGNALPPFWNLRIVERRLRAAVTGWSSAMSTRLSAIGMAYLASMALMWVVAVPSEVEAREDDPPTFTSHDCGCSEFGLDLDWGAGENRYDPRTLECHCGEQYGSADNLSIVIEYFTEPARAQEQFLDRRNVFESDVNRIEDDAESRILATHDADDRYGYLNWGKDITDREIHWGHEVLVRYDHYLARIEMGGPTTTFGESRARELFEKAEMRAIAIIDSQSGRYFIYPGVLNEVEAGEKADFRVVTADGTQIGTEQETEFAWQLGNCQSVSDYLEGNSNPDKVGITIAEVDEGTGELSARNIGTCELFLRHEGRTVDRVPVPVVCPRDVPGDLERMLRMYVDEIPSGPILEDSRTGKVSAGFGELTPGHANNLLYSFRASSAWAASWFKDLDKSWAEWAERYGPFVCGGYQGQVLKWLANRIAADGENCSLINGYQFLPIRGEKGAHHAVVIYPKEGLWQEDGTVLDPWPTQTPRHYPIADWNRKFYPAEEETFAADQALYKSNSNRASGVVHCPVDLLITDDQGRRSGVLDNGSTVQEIPDSFVIGVSDENNDYEWWYDLNADLSNGFQLQITGRAAGTFTLMALDVNAGTLQTYKDQPIAKGKTAELTIGASNPEMVLMLGSGDVVWPEVVPLEPERRASSTLDLLLFGSLLTMVAGLGLGLFAWLRQRRGLGR